MDAPADYETLVGLEPRLREIEERARAIRDDGSGPFFCSNYLWLPLSVELRGLVGVGRRGWSTHEPGDPLYDGRSYRVVYERLSPLADPCRGCGCHRFHGLADASTRAPGPAGTGEAPVRPSGSASGAEGS